MSAASKVTTRSTTTWTALSCWARKGKGVHDLVAKKCDFLVSIPMLGKVPSLNVSVAAGVMLYEIVRQRRKRRADTK